MKRINFLVILLLLISFFLSQSSQVYAAENVSDEIITLKPNETYDLENNRIVEMYALKDTVQPQNTALEVAGLGSIAAFLAANPLLSLGILLLGIAAIAVGVRFKSYLDAYDFGKKVRQLLSDAQFAAAIAGNNIVYTGPLILAIQKLRYQNIGLVEDDSINKYVRYHADNLKQLNLIELLGVGSVSISNSEEGIYDSTFYTKSITCDITRSTGFTDFEIRQLKRGFGSKLMFVNMAPYYDNQIKSDYISRSLYNDTCFGTVKEISNGYRLYFDSDMMNCSRNFLTRFNIGNDAGYSASFIGVDVAITFSNGKSIKLYGDIKPYNKYHLLQSTSSANLDTKYTINTNANVTTQNVDADTFKQLSNSAAGVVGESTLIARPTYASNVTEYSATAVDIPIDDTGVSDNAGSSENTEEEEKEKNEVGWLSKIFSLLKTFLSSLQKSVDDIGNFVKSIPDFILSIPEKISLALGEFVAGIQGIFDNLTSLVREIFQWLKDFFIPDFSKINQSISNLKNKFDNKFKSITSLLTSFKSIFTNGKSIYDLELTIFDTSFHPVPIIVKPVIDVVRTLFNAFIMFLAFNNVRKRFFGDGDAIAT